MRAKKNLTKEEKIAFALMSIGKDAAAQILQKLPDTEVRKINSAFARVQEISREDQLAITREFQTLLTAGEKVIVDGEQFARDVISQAFGNEASSEFLSNNSGANTEQLGRLIAEISEMSFFEMIKNEHPQTATFLLAKAPADLAARALQTLEEEQQTDLIMRMSAIHSVRSEITAELCEMLRASIAGQQSSGEEIHGPEIAARILSQLPRNNEERILTEIEEIDEMMADEVRSLMFTFEDLLKIGNRDIQKVLQAVSPEQLLAALRTASSDLTEHIFQAMTKRSAERTREELEEGSKIKLKDVEAAQQGIIDIARKLESDGHISIGSETDDEQWV